MAKIDHKRLLSAFYNPSASAFSTVEVPELQFLMIDGQGDPNTAPVYQRAVEALYALAYGIKFALKGSLEYAVMPLEGLWWAPDPTAFTLADKDAWSWTAMILQPPEVTGELLEGVRSQVARKKDLPALPLVRLGTYHEGLAAQILYRGAYSDEGPTIERLHAYIAAQGCTLAGKHHEIYLGDPRRAAPERLKTIIRQPMRCAG